MVSIIVTSWNLSKTHKFVCVCGGGPPICIQTKNLNEDLALCCFFTIIDSKPSSKRVHDESDNSDKEDIIVRKKKKQPVVSYNYLKNLCSLLHSNAFQQAQKLYGYSSESDDATEVKSPSEKDYTDVVVSNALRRCV